MLNLICLLDLDADAHAVYAGLDQHTLVLVSGYSERVEEDFGRSLGFDFRDIVSLGGLGCEVG